MPEIPRCEKEEDLAMIAAQQYFIEFGTDMNSERLMNLLPNYIPDYCLTGEKPVDHWHQLIIQAFKKVSYFGFCQCSYFQIRQGCFWLSDKNVAKFKSEVIFIFSI